MNSIGGKTMIGFTLIIMAVCIGLGCVASVHANSALRQAALGNLITRAEDGGKFVNNYIEADLLVLEVIAGRNVIQSMDWEQQLPKLKEEAARLNYASIGVADLNGVLRYTDGTCGPIADQKFITDALLGEKTFYNPSTEQDSMVLTLAVPIQNEGQIAGALVAARNAGNISQICQEIALDQNSYSFILNRQGAFLTCPDSTFLHKKYDEIPDEYAGLIAFIKTLNLKAKGNGSFLLPNGDAMIAGYAPIETTDWTMVVAADEKELLSEVNTLKKRIALASIIAMLWGLFIAFYFGRTISRPMKTIADYYLKTAEGDFSNRLDSAWTGRKDELGALALGYNMINFNIGAMVEKLTQNEQDLRRITDNMNDLISQIDEEGKLVYVSPSHLTVTGWKPEELLGKYAYEFHHPDDLENTIGAIREGFTSYQPVRCEFRFRTKEGAYKWLEGMGKVISDDNGINKIGLISARDIGARKKAELEMQYMADHDTLTALYNRSYFEQRLSWLDEEGIVPVIVLVCDLDGLKLVNDTLGHRAGDQLLISTARFLYSNSPKEATVARIGGDEFALLLPGYNHGQLGFLLDSLRMAIKEYNDGAADMPISVSMGYAVREDSRETLLDVLKKAEELMYREKLMHSRSNRSAIVEVVMRALEARDYITEGHTDRLQRIVTKLAETIGMHEHQINDLCLFARFHDIGKVGVPDYILLKTGRLTPVEYAEMKKHCEIGYRIAQSSPDLVHIADWILKHHEWWDGSGYPLGLKGGEIPLECRLLAIADAFDAMGNDRPYRAAKEIGEIKAELRRCAGVQFDPILVEYFLNMLADGVLF